MMASSFFSYRKPLPDPTAPYSNSKFEKIRLSVFRDIFLKSGVTHLNLIISWLYYLFQNKVAYDQYFY